MKLYIIIILYFLLHAIYADTVIFRTGRENSSVKAAVGQDFIRVNEEDGKQKVYDKKDVLKVKFEAVHWKKESDSEKNEFPEEKRLSIEAKKGNKWVQLSEEEKISPAGNAALSLIPSFSGLYRTENYFGGALFTFMELGLLKTVLGSSVIRRTDWLTRQYIQNDFRSYSNMLGAVLLADFAFTYFRTENWNVEGKFQGEKAPDYYPPTAPLSRLWRSALIPGWGQIYAGNTFKGGFMMTVFFISGFISQIADPSVIKSYKKEMKESDIEYAAFAYPYSDRYSIQQIADADITRIWLTDRFGAKSQIDFYRFDQNRFSTVLGAVWVISMIDAYFFSGRNSAESSEKEKSLSFRPEINTEKVKDSGTLKNETAMKGSLIYHW
ncbi:MAG TPA: DUF5683 domain-containing protein [Leptospiraceae bacterium]|nr:DUF5683 domain-containing protein [Leptospiraceae bacterium]